jgi:hypothetical protein
MKKTVLFLALAIFVFAARANDTEKEKEAIQKVIQTAYVDGLQNLGELEDIKNGFHPGFNLLGVNDNDMLTKFPIYSWIESFEKRKANNPDGRPEEEKITCQYKSIDVTGNAAMAKIELYKKEKKLFTDYLQLYKFDEGWQIVSKIYYRHE